MAAPKRQMQKRPAPTVVKKDESPQPRIAWHKLSIMDSIKLGENQDDTGEIQILAQALANGIATTEMVERLLELRDPERQREKFKKQFDIFAKYVEWLPTDWLKEGAPEKPDFSKPETYELLRPNRFGELFRLITFGSEQAELAGGN